MARARTKVRARAKKADVRRSAARPTRAKPGSRTAAKASRQHKFVASQLGPDSFKADGLRTYAHYGTKRAPNGRVIWKRDPNLAKGFVETELWQYVRRIACPTIYIIGGRSTIVPVETQAQLKTTVPGVEIVTMAGLGHYPSQEEPEAFLRIVNAFLERRAR